MATFYINGAEVTVAKKQKLLRYLRDELHLTSVKDGCSEGACGACTVLINGEPCRACVPDTERLDGKHILTVEGLSDFEKAAYTFAFGEAGAVQCGFCIPGMVLCAKALLDRTPDPTEEQIRWAIRNNYCRCTGYVKIVEAIRLAGKILREKKIPLPATTDWKIGSRVQRLDVEEKVLGTGKYPDDYYPEKMCYGSAVRSKYPRARVLSIDTSKAAALPGVICVLTAADVPGENIIGHIVHDWDVMVPVGGVVHFLGDALALVAAETPEILEKAKKLVKVEYEILPAVGIFGQRCSVPVQCSDCAFTLPEKRPSCMTASPATFTEPLQRTSPAQESAPSIFAEPEHCRASHRRSPSTRRLALTRTSPYSPPSTRVEPEQFKFCFISDELPSALARAPAPARPRSM